MNGRASAISATAESRSAGSSSHAVALGSASASMLFIASTTASVMASGSPSIVTLPPVTATLASPSPIGVDSSSTPSIVIEIDSSASSQACCAFGSAVGRGPRSSSPSKPARKSETSEGESAP